MAILTHCPHCGKIQLRPDKFEGQTISCSHCRTSFLAVRKTEDDAVYEPEQIEVVEESAAMEPVYEPETVEVVESAPDGLSINAETDFVIEPSPAAPEAESSACGPLELEAAKTEPVFDDVEVIGAAGPEQILSPVTVAPNGELILNPLPDDVEVVAPVALGLETLPPAPAPSRLAGPLDIRLAPPRKQSRLTWLMYGGLGLGLLVVLLAAIGLILFLVNGTGSR